MVLCDAVQLADGKLWMLGAGWNRIPANQPAPQGLGIIVHVPYDMANQKRTLEVWLLDSDGEHVMRGDPLQPVGSKGEFEIGRPAGVKPGEHLNFHLALRFNGIQHQPGGYVWEASVDGEAVARWPFQAVA